MKKSANLKSLWERARKMQKVASTSTNKMVQNLSNGGIDTELQNMLLENEINIFAGWPKDKKILFYETTQVRCPEIPERSVGRGDVLDSVVFDMTDPNVILANYCQAICHYRSWQLAGSDCVYEWSESQRTLSTRKSRTFVFWYRYKSKDVGLVIDGQTGWVEGFLKRIVNDDGPTHLEALQFQTKSDKKEKKMKGKGESKPAMEGEGKEKRHVYIESENKVDIDLDGRYKGSVCDMTLGGGSLKEALFVVCGRVTGITHKCSDLLILYGPEAAKNYYIFEYTLRSFVEDDLSIPNCLDPLVTNYDKISRRTLEALAQGGSNFEAVYSVPLRSLYQCLDAFPILKRISCSKTKFYLPDRKSEFERQLRQQPPVKIMKRGNETRAKWEERARSEAEKLELEHGTIFEPGRHSCLKAFTGIKWRPMASQDIKWYNL